MLKRYVDPDELFRRDLIKDWPANLIKITQNLLYSNVKKFYGRPLLLVIYIHWIEAPIRVHQY